MSISNKVLPLAAAKQQVFEALQHSIREPLGSEVVALPDTLGRVIAETLHAPRQVPPFRASAMDGYAISRRSDQLYRRLIGHSLAGHPANDELADDECVRITTGARLPDMADTVVPQEDVDIDGQSIHIRSLPASGYYVRDTGSDTASGDVLVTAGSRIRAPTAALLATHGLTEIPVIEKLRIAIFSTGDELVDPGEPIAPGQIYEANRLLLTGLLQSPAVEITDYGIVKDCKQSLHDTLARTRNAHVVVSSGGVSVGDADYIKEVLAKDGKINMWKIAMKPGRPLTFGFTGAHQPYFGLPGNPVSAAITCLMFLLPAIEQLTGQSISEPPRLPVSLANDITKEAGRLEFQRGYLTQCPSGQWQVASVGKQDSHRINSLQQANCLIELPLECADVSTGEVVEVIPFAWFGDKL